MQGTIEKTENVIRILVFEVALKAAIASAIAAYPILGVTGIRQIFTFIVEKVTTLIFDEMAKVVVFSVIDFKNEHDLKEYQEAVVKLKTVIETPPEHYDHGTEGENKRKQEIEKAKEEYKKKLAYLIRFNP